MKRAITPGTFDPLTNGHLDIIERASSLFDEVIVAVASSEKKQPLFDLGERLFLVKEATSHLENVSVAPMKGLLVEFARENDATVLVKGLRATTDFEYEFAMTAANFHMDESIETLFMMPAPNNMYLSSSLVREIASFNNSVEDFVPSCVADALRRKFALRASSWNAYYSSLKTEYGFNSYCKMSIPDDLQGKTVLDVGCRRGKGIYKLSEMVGESGKAIGIDWEPSYIAEARIGASKALDKSGISHSNMQFIVGYPEDLAASEIKDASIDVVWVNSVHNLFADQRKAFSEFARVLKPGGQLVCETVFSSDARDMQVVKQARALGNCIQSALPRESFNEVLACAGFNDVRLEEEHDVEPYLGYVEEHKVAVAPSVEQISFIAAVAYATKKGC